MSEIKENLAFCCESCKCVYPLGCFNICDALDVGFIAPVTGVYTLVTKYLGATQVVRSTVLEGCPVCFNVCGLNGNYTYKSAALFDAKGERIILKDEDGKEYDCISFKLQIINYVDA